MVGGDDEPRGVFGAAPGERVLVSRRVVVPVGSLLVIGLADLPLLGRVVEPILEALQLLVFRDVQEELEDVGIVLDEAALERVDAGVTGRPDLSRDQVVHADDQDVLVVRAVEDGHLAPCGRGPVDPPQEVVGAFLGGRLLEPHHLAPLRVHRAQEVVDRPVLAPRVQRLQTDQERPPPLGVEQLLEFLQPLPVVLGLLGRLLVALVRGLEPWVDVIEFHGGAGPHPEALDVVHTVPPANVRRAACRIAISWLVFSAPPEQRANRLVHVGLLSSIACRLLSAATSARAVSINSCVFIGSRPTSSCGSPACPGRACRCTACVRRVCPSPSA